MLCSAHHVLPSEPLAVATLHRREPAAHRNAQVNSPNLQACRTLPVLSATQFSVAWCCALRDRAPIGAGCGVGGKGRRRAGRALCCPGVADWVGEGYRSGTPCPSLLMVRRAFAHLVFKDATRAARSDAANDRGVIVFHKLKLEPHLPWAVRHGLSLRALRILCSALKRRDRIGPGRDGDRRDRQAGGS